MGDQWGRTALANAAGRGDSLSGREIAALGRAGQAKRGIVAGPKAGSQGDAIEVVFDTVAYTTGGMGAPPVTPTHYLSDHMDVYAEGYPEFLRQSPEYTSAGIAAIVSGAGLAALGSQVIQGSLVAGGLSPGAAPLVAALGTGVTLTGGGVVAGVAAGVAIVAVGAATVYVGVDMLEGGGLDRTREAVGGLFR